MFDTESVRQGKCSTGKLFDNVELFVRSGVRLPTTLSNSFPVEHFLYRTPSFFPFLKTCRGHGLAWLVKLLEPVTGVIFKVRGSKGCDLHTESYGR